MDASEELQVALRAAREAGSIAAEHAGTDFRDSKDTESKSSGNDLVTAVDRECEQRVTDIIAEAFPDDRVVGEENEIGVTGEGREWIVDPIDGTSNFATGYPYYCVSVALRIDGGGVVGVVHSPDTALGRTWYAAAGEGAYRSDDHTLDGEPIAVSEHDTLAGSMVFARLSERSRAWLASDLAVATSLLERESMVRRPGSSALNMCQIADGSADGYVVLSINDWDVAAGEVILREAGGGVRDRALEDGTRQVIASNGSIQGALETLIDQVVGDRR
ncbi:Inositol monophosphatase [Halorhabdus sp. SVX81]|uniref:inositol monophosphatase family protein n=1 Tax=Halorhabdus sp. SVX81 TaxID=2978283 RepID=UPI0023DB6B41|nr:inositol monophosphatase family protein [Halorhabdus sp. SVX81]WEL17780.1 Inositol monophosphatase [Halorhabdus sp. SVX81]